MTRLATRALLGVVLSLSAVAMLAAVRKSESDHSHGHAGEVRLYDDLGTHSRRITTSSEQAQRWFDQGLRLQYAFNHELAIRSYREAVRLDPSCAMCWWGIALASGPNINGPMSAEGERSANQAIAQAERLAPGASPLERELIEALSLRYSTDTMANRASLDSAWSNAMAKLARENADDADILTLYGASLMNLSPWNYWDGEFGARTPRAGTETILTTLESALRLNPDHPGACHYFIHTVEAAFPRKALPCAERLPKLMPGAGHIVHMPGHIYIRVGRYADAVRANEHAVHSDEERIGDQMGMGLYAGAYYPHNYHFMAFAATMAGMSETALRAARIVAPKVPVDVARDVYWIQNAVVLPQLTLLTFGRWAEVLDEPLPAAELEQATILALYARGVAFAALGDVAQARSILADIRERGREAKGKVEANPIPHIAPLVLEAEIALRTGDVQGAVKGFRAAADIEDMLLYDEPPLWYYPIRQSLGRALLEAGRPAEAETAFRRDLAKFPENGWSLYGLKLSLEAQGRMDEAIRVDERYRSAWADADVSLSSSRF